MADGKVQYTSADYESLRQNVLQLIPLLTPKWTDFNESDLGIVLVDIFCGIGDMLGFYLDRRVNENYIDTAKLRKSIISLTKLIDYRLSRPTAAETTLEFSVSSPAINNILIPKYTVCQTAGKMPFITIENAVIYAQQTSTTITARQGALRTETFTATGDAYQEYPLTAVAAENLLHVYVGDEQWTEDSGGILNPENYKVFRADTDWADKTKIVFSSRRGYIPGRGQTITVRYAETLGPGGNIESPGQITNIITTFPNSKIVDVTNIERATGGKLRESEETARLNGPASIRALNRAVAPSDYEHLALKFPGVAKARQGKGIPSWKSVNLYVAPAGGGAASAAMKQSLMSYFRERMCPTVELYIRDPQYVEIVVEANVYLKPNASRVAVNRTILGKIREYFSFDKQDFGGANAFDAKGVFVSDLYQLIRDIPDIKYIEFTRLARVGGEHMQSIILKEEEIPKLAEGHPILTLVGGI